MIEEHKFGSFIVMGKQYLGDIKIVNGRVKYWDDREKHLITMKDVRDLLDANPGVFIVGAGNSGLLKVDNAVKDALLSKRIQLVVKNNDEAVKLFNDAFYQNKRVVGLFHATC